MIYTAEIITDPYEDFTVNDTEFTKYVDVLLHPQGNVLRRIPLSRVASSYSQPAKGSMVLVFRQDNFNAKIISVLRDPVNTSGNIINPLRGEGESGKDQFKPGEVLKESQGKAFLYLNNKGMAKLSASDSTEQFVADSASSTAYVRGINVVLTNGTQLNVLLDKDSNLILQQTDSTTNLERASIKITSTGNIEISTTKDISITGGTIKLKGLAGATKKLLTDTFLSVFKGHKHSADLLISPTGPVTGVTGTPVVPIIDADNTTSITEAE